MTNKPDLSRQLFTVPVHVVIGVRKPVLRLSTMFEYSIEHLLDGIIEAVADKNTVSHNLNHLSKRLMGLVKDTPNFEEFGYIDRMVALEQCALDIAQYLDDYRLYLYGRYLPYRFETLMVNGSILLMRVQNYDEFCERISHDMGFNEGE